MRLGYTCVLERAHKNAHLNNLCFWGRFSSLCRQWQDFHFVRFTTTILSEISREMNVNASVRTEMRQHVHKSKQKMKQKSRANWKVQVSNRSLGAKLPWYKAGEVVETDGLVPDRIDPAEVTLGFPVLGALQIAGGCAKVAVMSFDDCCR